MFSFLTRSLRAPGGPCTKSMEVSESRMERVNIRIYEKQSLERTPKDITIIKSVCNHRLGPFTRHWWVEDGLTMD